MKAAYFKRLIPLLAAILLFGCAAPVQAAPALSSGVSAAISFTDDDGVAVSLEKPAERIISLYSAHTENLYSLGAGERVIGGHTTCIYPPEAAAAAVFDYTGDPEYVIAAEPDLVIIRPFIRRKSPNFVTALQKAGVTVVSLYPESYGKFPDYIRKLALLCGKEPEAEELLTAFFDDIDAISDITSEISPKQRVFFEATEVELRTVSENSMADMAIRFAGGENIAAGAKPISEGGTIAAFGAERILQHAEDIDLYISQRGAMNAGGNLISISERPGFSAIKAVREGRVLLLNEKLVSSPTFRYYKGVREIARFLYPKVLDSLEEYQSGEAATRSQFADILTRSLHLPVYLPSSSKYYQTAQKGHTYGFFEDIDWTSRHFDSVETAVYAGLIEWRREGEREYFDPEGAVTREALARAVFLAGDFSAKEQSLPVSDLSVCQKPRIIQTLVDNGVFELYDGKFQPQREVTCGEIIAALEFVG